MEGGQNLSNKLWPGLSVVVCVTHCVKRREEMQLVITSHSLSQPGHTSPWEMFTSPCEVVYNTQNISIYCTICQHCSFYQPHQRDAEEVMCGTTYEQQQCHKALLCSLGCPGYPTLAHFPFIPFLSCQCNVMFLHSEVLAAPCPISDRSQPQILRKSTKGARRDAQ